MKANNINRIQKPADNHRVERPRQTGFSSPATHYNEPRIDLNSVLVNNSEATFYIRVVDESFAEFDIHKDDVLIVDKSLNPQANQLAIVIQEDSFQILRMKTMELSEMTVWGVITYIIKSVV
ncbi:DNA polymerase V [Nonlabens sp. Hel1_33_55]|uniref:S24 family peptidase n=1 Tax=Nonlabens sp. Hel1_33_55 TaxID=1336802 RepID=UPI000875D55F|nr:S24 family peptidase [Nonlabens sp. Hel1_33_55]SCY41370.1 DNA polymerase V [Nonlabens sp. Hel1_33_55]